MKKLFCVWFLVVAAAASQAKTQPQPLLAEIKMFAGTFAPRGWAFCEGQTLQISQNSALFSLLGTTYGGDGRTTFKLPDLRGRVPVHPGAVDVGTREGTVGAIEPGVAVKGNKRGSGASQTPTTVRIHYIICIQGAFPSRS